MKDKLRFVVCCAVILVAVIFVIGCSAPKDENQKSISAVPKASDAADVNPSSNAKPEPGRSVDDLIELAKAAMVAKNWDEARQFLRSGLLIRPDHSTLIFLSAQLEASTGDIAAAIESLRSIEKSDPDFGIAAIGQSAQWLAELGRLVEARSKYREALRMSPDLEFLRRQFAQFLAFAGWRYEARDVLMPLVASGRSTESELRFLINLCDPIVGGTLLTGDIAETQLSPLNRAVFSLSNRQPRVAVNVIEAAIKARRISRDAASDAILVAAYTELQQFDRVSELLADASTEIEQQPLFWRAMGDRSAAEGRWNEASGAYLKSVALDATNQVTLERLEAGLLQLGEQTDAKNIQARRVTLLSVRQLVTQIEPSLRDELVQAVELAKTLEATGRVVEAAAWLQLVASRNRSPQTDAALQDELQRLSLIPDTDSADRSRCGIRPDRYPLPTLQDIQAIADGETSREDSAASNRRTVAKFVDVANKRGLIHTYQNSASPKLKNFQIYEALGAGAAAIDFDADGRIDFYVGQGGCDPRTPGRVSNVLFRNLEAQFTNVTESASAGDFHFTNCVTSGDVNQDGFADLLIGNLGLNRMLINQGDGTFRDVSDFIGWTDPTTSHYTMGLAIADVNDDRIPDIVEVNYVNDPSMYESLPIGPDGDLIKIPGPLNYPAEADIAWISGGEAAWHPVVLGESSVQQDYRYPGLGLIVSNFDDQAGLEIFVANDVRPNQLWKRKSGDFIDVAFTRGCALSSRGQACACMGVAWADFDGNATPDLMITNWFDEWLNFYLFDADGMCRDVAPRFGLDTLSESLLGFGCQPIDFDNDTDVDAMVANGHIDHSRGGQTALKMPTQLLENLSTQFVLGDQADPSYWGRDHLGRCVITADHNGDGRLDALIVDLIDPIALLENQTETGNHWIQVQLVGTQSERDAIGTRIEVTSAGVRQVTVTASGDGYQGRNESLSAFGLADSDAKVTLEIRWPSGLVSDFSDVDPDTRYLVIEDRMELWTETTRNEQSR